MRIAVTGANGFVGQALCPFLKEHLNAEIITLTRNPSITNDKLLSFSATDDSLAHSLNSVDCLIHLAARAHSHRSTLADFERDNLALSERIARLSISANIPRLIYLSSIKVNGNSTQGRPPFSADETPHPDDAYGQSKLASEQLLKSSLSASTTDLVIIRPPLIYGQNNKGNLASLEKLIRLGLPLPFEKVTNQRDLVSIENLCSFIRLCVTHPKAANETFLVSDGVSRTTNQIIELLAKYQNLATKSFRAPNWIFRLAKHLNPQVVERLTGDLQLNINKTETLLNWRPHN
jgi:nucleoside-diphosphate-sugar epimerase